MALLLGVDIGTTGLKAALVNGDGRVLAEAGREYPTQHPHPGWAEQDPDGWWRAMVSASGEVVARAGCRGKRLAGICVSSMAPVVVPLDAKGRALGPGLIWADKRADAESAELENRIGATRLNEITANRASSYYAAPKIMWLQRHRPDLFAATSKFVMANGYVNYRLTGRVAVDHSHSPLLLLADAATCRWSDELLEAAGLPRELFPEIRPALDIIGELTPDAAAELGVAPGAPVLTGTVDTPAAVLGMGITAPRQAFVSMGTGSNVGACMPGPAFGQPLVSLPHALPGMWLVIGVMTSTGASLKWFKNQVCPGFEEAVAPADPYDMLASEAGNASAGSRGLIFLPYLMGEQTPIWDNDARGTFVGIAPDTTRGEMVRAILEGAAYGVRHNLETCEAAGLGAAGLRAEEVRIQGGAARSAVWTQIICDVVNRPVLAPPVSAGAAVGDAALAGLATGVFPDAATAVAACATPRAVYRPGAEAATRYDHLYPIYRAIYEQLRPSFRALAGYRREFPAPTELT